MVRDLGLLESALLRPQTGYYDALSLQAAALMQSLCQGRCFVDGNKRVAFATAAIFLRLNGFRLAVDAVGRRVLHRRRGDRQPGAGRDDRGWLEARMSQPMSG